MRKVKGMDDNSPSGVQDYSFDITLKASLFVYVFRLILVDGISFKRTYVEGV